MNPDEQDNPYERWANSGGAYGVLTFALRLCDNALLYKTTTRLLEVARPYFPYVLKEVNGGRGMLVNRDYMPVGLTTDDGLRYLVDTGDYLGWVVSPDELRAALAAPECWGGSTGALFHDASTPWRDRSSLVSYRERLRALRLVLSNVPRVEVAQPTAPGAKSGRTGSTGLGVVGIPPRAPANAPRRKSGAER